MSADPLSPLVNALRAAVPPPQDATRLATVTGFASTGHVLVQFDGESVASARSYLMYGSVPLNGSRVLMVRAGSTWVCAGTVDQWGTNLAIRGLLSAPQSIPSGAWTVVTNWLTSNNTGALDGSSGIVWAGGGVWTLNAPGWYRFEMGFAFSNTGAGNGRFGTILINNVQQVSQGYAVAAGHTAGGMIGWEARVTAGQNVRFGVYQDSGAALNLVGSIPEYRTWYTIRRVAA